MSLVEEHGKEPRNPDPQDPVEPLEIMQIITFFDSTGPPCELLCLKNKWKYIHKDGLLVLFTFASL